MSNKITGLLRRGTAFAVTGLMMVGSSGLSWVDLTAEAATAPPEYVVTVYWNVVNDNNNRANYIRLNYKYPKVTASGNEVLTNAKTGYEFIDKVAETSGSNVQSFTVQGIPDSLDLSVWGKTADKSEFYVERVTIKAADPVAYCGINTITLWERKFGCKISTINGATNGNTRILARPRLISTAGKTQVWARTVSLIQHSTMRRTEREFSPLAFLRWSATAISMSRQIIRQQTIPCRAA